MNNSYCTFPSSLSFIICALCSKSSATDACSFSDAFKQRFGPIALSPSSLSSSDSFSAFLYALPVMLFGIEGPITELEGSDDWFVTFTFLTGLDSFSESELESESESELPTVCFCRWGGRTGPIRLSIFSDFVCIRLSGKAGPYGSFSSDVFCFVSWNPLKEIW